MSQLIDINVWIENPDKTTTTLHQGWAADCADLAEAKRSVRRVKDFAQIAYGHYLENALNLEKPPFHVVPENLACSAKDGIGSIAIEAETLCWSVELR